MNRVKKTFSGSMLVKIVQHTDIVNVAEGKTLHSVINAFTTR